MVGGENYEIVDIEVDENLTEDEIENKVSEIYTEWLFENNSGGFNEVTNE